MRRFITHLSPPLLLAAYPVVFLYQVNASILRPSSLLLPLAVAAGLAILVYACWFVTNGHRALQAGNAALGSVLSFILYGSTYSLLLNLDVVPIDHYRLLPTILLAGLYAGLILGGLPLSIAQRLRQAVLFILGGLIVYNLAGIVVVEYRKSVGAPSARSIVNGASEAKVGNRKPDVYFIILDEFAGFDVIREYWDYTQIGSFEEYLADKGFYVAATSRSRTASTLYELAARLNYQYPEDEQDRVYYSGLIAHNKVMQQFTSLGYTTVVFDGTGGAFAFPGKVPIAADFTFEYVPGSTEATRNELDEFAKMVFDRTMLRVLTDANREFYGPIVSHYRDNILYTFERVVDLENVPSPKFVFAHIMLPHMPFVFDESGRPNDMKHLYDWNYYLGSYVFATKKTQDLIDRILLMSDPENPPIIIIQSDHGARNSPTEDPDSVVLPDYPEDFQYHILNAMLLPGSDYSQLTPDFAPVNTFPLILNLYFGERIPLQ